MRQNRLPFGSPVEAFFYPALLLVAMWLVYWAEHLFLFQFHTLGVLPRTIEGLKGIVLMPLIHSDREIQHILNNSVPIFILLAALIYFYRKIALRVFVISWIMTGFLVWIYAENKGAYHIGMSGVIYALAGFLFTSGVIRKYLPLQGISLFVVFVYGSLIWGIFPMQQSVSWEGHFMGLLIGVILAFVYRKEGPQRPKLQYEIEKELGIEPPDLEGIWLEKVRKAREEQERREAEEKEKNDPVRIIYHFRKPGDQDLPHQDENRQQ
jgi:membrane associated rhomboid family serine protease